MRLLPAAGRELYVDYHLREAIAFSFDIGFEFQRLEVHPLLAGLDCVVIGVSSTGDVRVLQLVPFFHDAGSIVTESPFCRLLPSILVIHHSGQELHVKKNTFDENDPRTPLIFNLSYVQIESLLSQEDKTLQSRSMADRWMLSSKMRGRMVLESQDKYDIVLELEDMRAVRAGEQVFIEWREAKGTGISDAIKKETGWHKFPSH